MKYFFKRILPAPEKLNDRLMLRMFLQRFSRAQIWQVNRHSIATSIAIGLFFGNLPIPVQIPCAAIVAIFWRCNLPTAIFTTFFSNPLTMAPIYYVNYCLGAWLIDSELPAGAHFNFAHLTHLGGRILIALYTGSVVMGLIAAGIGFVTVRVLWRLSLVRTHKQRHRRR